MNGASADTNRPTPPAEPTVDPLDAARVDWMDWGIRLANDLHRLPQNASRRQRRLLTALCTRLEADAGSTSVFAGAPLSDNANPPADPLARPSANGVTPTGIRRVYFVGHDRIAPPVPLAPQRSDASTNVSITEPPATAEFDGAGDLLKRMNGMPTAWSGWDARDAVAFSLIRLADDRVSLLELRRRAADGLGARAFADGTLAAMAAVHRGCAWACDASPLLGMSSVPGLSPRERETLEHLLAGASEKEVAAMLQRSPHTVHSYIKRIYRQLGVRSRAELLAIFVDAGGRN